MKPPILTGQFSRPETLGVCVLICSLCNVLYEIVSCEWLCVFVIKNRDHIPSEITYPENDVPSIYFYRVSNRIQSQVPWNRTQLL